MNLSRSEGRRKVPTLTLAKGMYLLLGFLVLVIVSFVLYIRSADSEYRQSEKAAIRIALEQGGLVEVTDTVVQTWDETVWVVSGYDAEGEQWMIFERENELVRRKMSEQLSEQEMRDKLEREHGVEPIRMIPGWFKEQPVWEVRYWNEGSSQQQSLDFYSFEDGTLLKKYILTSLK